MFKFLAYHPSHDLLLYDRKNFSVPSAKLSTIVIFRYVWFVDSIISWSQLISGDMVEHHKDICGTLTAVCKNDGTNMIFLNFKYLYLVKFDHLPFYCHLIISHLSLSPELSLPTLLRCLQHTNQLRFLLQIQTSTTTTTILAQPWYLNSWTCKHSCPVLQKYLAWIKEVLSVAPNSCRNLVIPAESGGMKFGRMACYFLHSGVISFQWNLGIPELRPECSVEFTGTECNGMESSCLVTTLFGIHCLFVAHLLTNKHNILPFPPPTIVSHHHHLSFPPPPTMLVTTTALRDCPWMPMTTNDRSATMTGQKTKTATNKRQPMPTPRTMAWTHERTWVVTSPGESTRSSSPFISFIWNTGATSQLVTWQPNDERWRWQHRHLLLLLILDTTVSIPNTLPSPP